MFHNQMPDGTPRPRFTPGDGLAGARVPMGFGNSGETKIKDGMPATGVSDITPLPGPPMSGGKGGGNGEMPRPMPAPAPSTQYSPMAAPAPAPAQPQGFNVNQAAAGGLQQAMLGTQQAMGYRPQAVQPVSYQAQTAQASGYRPSAMTSKGYASTGTTATGYLSLIHI